MNRRKTQRKKESEGNYVRVGEENRRDLFEVCRHLDFPDRTHERVTNNDRDIGSRIPTTGHQEDDQETTMSVIKTHILICYRMM